jgi:hypothetical protein
MLESGAIEGVVLAGLACGLVLGGAARGVRFCTFGAIEDVVMTGNTVRLRTWFFAMAVAMLVTQFAAHWGYARLDETAYLARLFPWAAALAGGTLFGFGMALAGNCGYGTIIRMSSGDMRAMAVFVVLGISAYVTARGIISPLRKAVFDPLAADFGEGGSAGIGAVFSAASGLPALVPAMLISAVLAIWCFASPKFRASPKDIAAAAIIGAAVGGGFVLTSAIGETSFDPVPVQSVSYALPPGETLLYFMTYTGARMDFGIAAILGTIIGAFAVALIKHEIRLEGFDEARDMRRQMLGAVLMGAGGVTAGGCTVGQGLAGIATLSLAAPLAIAGILVGAAAGVQYLIGGRMVDILGALALHDFRTKG